MMDELTAASYADEYLPGRFEPEANQADRDDLITLLQRVWSEGFSAGFDTGLEVNR